MAKMSMSGAKYERLVNHLEATIEFKKKCAKAASGEFMESGMLNMQVDDLSKILKDVKELELK